MALSGAYQVAAPNTNGQIAIRFDWTASQSVPNNNSTVKVTAKIVRGTYGYNSGSTAQTWNLWINGAHFNGTTKVGGASNTTTTVTTQTATVGHNADGSKTFAIAYTQNFGITYSGRAVPSTTTGNRSFTLNPIPRASSISSVSSIILGQNPVMNIASHSTSFFHVADCQIDGKTIQSWQNLKGGNNTMTLNDALVNAIKQKLTTSTSMQLHWVISTHSGSSIIGAYASKDSTVSLPANEIAPTAGTLSVAEANSEAISNFQSGNYVQSVSQLTFSVTGSSALHGASITNTTISFEGKDYANGATSDVISGSGIVKATATVTDSRGQKASTSIDVNVTAYWTPRIITAIASRTNADGGFVSDGQYCTVLYSIEATDLPLLNGKNTSTLTISKQQVGDTSYVQSNVIPIDDVTGEGSVVLGDGFDGTKEYNIKVDAADAAGSHTTVIIGLDVAHVLMSWGKTQVGIGKVAQQGTLDVLGDTFVNGEFYTLNPNDSTNKSGMGIMHNLDATSQTYSTDLMLMDSTGRAGTLTPKLLTQLNNCGKLIWDGAQFMFAAQYCDLPDINETLNGWLLVWNNWANAKIDLTGGYHVTPIWKAEALHNPGNAMHFSFITYDKVAIDKYIYVEPKKIRGNDMNNGVPNGRYVLTRVYEF